MRRLLVPLCRPLLIAGSLIVLGGIAGGQSTGKPPSETIESLSRVDPYVAAGFFTCGVTLWEEKDRALAAQLARNGSAAVVQLETVFDSLQTRGRESPYFGNAGWFFFAYSSMLGPTANLRLRAMIADPKLVGLQFSLDEALALS